MVTCVFRCMGLLEDYIVGNDFFISEISHFISYENEMLLLMYVLR